MMAHKSNLFAGGAILPIISILLVLSASVRAADYYLNVTESSTNYGAFTNATYWIDSAGTAQTEWDPEGTYHVATTNPVNATPTVRVLRTPNIAGPVTFPGGQLVIENNSGTTTETFLYAGTTGAGAVFPSGILLKNYSRIMPLSSGGAGENPGTDANPYVIDGDITTTLGDIGTLPIFKANADGRAVTVRGRILGSLGASASLKLMDSAHNKFTVDLGNSLSDYSGTLDVVTYDSYTDYPLKLVFGTCTCAGKIYPHRNDMFYDAKTMAAVFAIASVDDEFRIQQFGLRHSGAYSGAAPSTRVNGNFTLQNGMAFEFPVDGASGKSGQFIVTGTLIAPEANVTNVIIKLVGNGVGSVTNKFATLSVPKAASISADNFTLKTPSCSPWAPPPWLTVEENGNYKTVFVTVPPETNDVVYLMKSDNASHSGSYSTSVFTDPTAWSSEAVPEAGKIYVMAGTNDVLRAARTPTTPSSYAFPDGASLYLWGQARIQTKIASVTFNDLRSFDGVLGKNMTYSNTKPTTGIYKMLNAADVTTVNGNITVESGYFSFGCFHGQKFVIDARLHGTGTVAFSGMYTVDWDMGSYVLRGVNDDFYGKMRLCVSYKSGYTPSYEESWSTTGKGYSMLWVSDGRSLGANLAVPTPDALQLTDFGRLVATNSFTIAAESNRGVSIEENAVIQVAADKVVRIETPLTISGRLYKEGAGTLALAGDATAATGADSLIVTNGTIQLAGANAVAGLTVRLAAGTSLAVEPGIGDKGVDLTATTLELDDSFAGVLPLCGDSGVASRELPEYESHVPLFTVNTSDKAAFQAMLPQRPPKFYAHTTSRWKAPVDDLEAGTTTFSVRAFHVSLIMSFK